MKQTTFCFLLLLVLSFQQALANNIDLEFALKEETKKGEIFKLSGTVKELSVVDNSTVQVRYKNEGEHTASHIDSLLFLGGTATLDLVYNSTLLGKNPILTVQFLKCSQKTLIQIKIDIPSTDLPLWKVESYTLVETDGISKEHKSKCYFRLIDKKQFFLSEAEGQIAIHPVLPLVLAVSILGFLTFVGLILIIYKVVKRRRAIKAYQKV